MGRNLPSKSSKQIATPSPLAQATEKVRSSQNSPTITTQLSMPGESQNQTDSIFNKELIMDVKETEDGKVATFDFVINR